MLRRLAAAAAAAAVMMTGFVAGTAHADPGPAVLGGGSGIVMNDELVCSITTIGNDSAGRLVGLTAGHCGEVGWPVVSEYKQDAGVVGHVAAVDHSLDYAVVEFDRAKVVPVNRVGNVTITQIGAPAQFPQIGCKEGRTTGNTCGVVWGDVLQSQETWTQACVIEGDSGAPVVVGTTLVAMVNAYLLVPCLGPEVGTNLTQIMDAINSSGGPGAGFRPI
ncbi:serine protease [Rhodococcus sp. HNM0569]|uniref:serine protease n=1 Tax=Rhodococcus sp. HNM0569 TaxID=2716340 RepID=UPI00146E418A|nr:serine protease [Rhodococcus sp. HNM0569]NLU83760.1 serine protease [Rhodococcus sp. HNM0569]